ncbi:MAG TPA: response regulator, partial [Rhodocyclaceae bacterium]|nr:response regulator [Rhodocyclaceae bacterium]
LEAWKTVGGHRRIARESLDAYLLRRAQLTPSSSGFRTLDIIIMEENPALQALYRQTMDKWNLPLKLRIVDNGVDGLLQIGQAAPDILIADLTIPGVDGPRMIRRLRTNTDLARMDVIVVSALPLDQLTVLGELPA